MRPDSSAAGSWCGAFFPARRGRRGVQRLPRSSKDVAQDEEDADELINVPTLALWGKECEAVGQMYDVIGIWQQMARNVRGVALDSCGHLPHEEQPAAVNRELLTPDPLLFLIADGVP